MLDKVYQRFGKKKVWAAAFVIGLVIPALVFVWTADQTVAPEEEMAARTVELINVADYQSGAMGLAVPSADGRSFVVRAESSGRVDRVVEAKKVASGAVIAELDNDAQRASLLQAEGAYEAALAAAGRSDSSVNDANAALLSAKQTAVSTDQAALTAWNSALFNSVDQLFSNPYQKFPSVTISHPTLPSDLPRVRGELNTALSDWQTEVADLDENDSPNDLRAALDKAISRIDRLSYLVDTFITVIPRITPDNQLTEADLARIAGELASAKSSLNGQRAALQGASVGLTRAEEAQRSAEFGGTGSAISSANAQIKQALGVYEAARSAYDKTIVRAPFSGTIASLNVAVGDIVNYGSDVAIIVPDNGVETERSFNLPLSAVKYTPDGALVFIVKEDGTAEATPVEAGLVTAGSIKVTGLAGSEKIVLDVRGLKAGEVVSAK